jgi:hypothetical protein
LPSFSKNLYFYKMKYIPYLSVMVALSTIVACGHGKPADETTTTGTPSTLVPSSSTTQPQTTPVNLNSNTLPATPAIATPTTATTAGLNPPHGQPGHRCEIAVGAPLNTAPAQPTSPAIQTTPTTPVNISTSQPAQPVINTAATAPGMNPAHGQPGHRCDIAVGAPLNSKPAQQPATNTTTPVNLTTEQAAKPVASTKVAPGMNPAHGEPGHRCDIAVGAPLDSKPTVVQGIPSKETVTSSSIPAVVPVKPVQEIKKNNR